VPVQGDLIVALGDSSGPERLERALELYREGYGKGVLLTGFDQAGQGRNNFYRRWEAKFLIERGGTV
jgi:hypothetical protein